MATRRRAPWPLYVVISGAALTGSFAVILAMRSGAGAPAADTGGAAAVETSIIARPPSTITVVPIEQPEPDAISGPDQALAAAAATATPGGSGEDLAARPGRPQPGDPVAAVPRAPVAPRKAGAGSTIGRLDARAASRPAAKREPGEDEIAHEYAAGRYDAVVELCSAGPVTAEHAPLCFIAACHADNEPKARKLIGAVPPARREQLITNCKQLGVDITAHKKPGEDCEADPMACQH